MARTWIESALEGLAGRLRRGRDELERADRMLERGEDLERVRASVERARRIAEWSLEVVRGLLDESDGPSSTDGDAADLLESLGGGGVVVEIESGAQLENISEGRLETIHEIAGQAVASFRGAVDGDAELRVGRSGARIILTLVESADEGEAPRPDESIDGLREIREHVRELGGELRVESSWAEGTRVEISLDFGSTEAG